MKKLIVISVPLLLAACATKQKIMDAPMVSMTYMHLPENSRLVPAGSVAGRFCPDSMHDKGPIGLFDQAIQSAQTEHSVDFISNATFYAEGHCVTLEGTGERVVTSTSNLENQRK